MNINQCLYVYFLGFIVLSQSATGSLPCEVGSGDSKKTVPHINNISDLDSNFRSGDFVVVDIDETIIKTGKDRYDDKTFLLSLDTKFPHTVRRWMDDPKGNIRFTFLTARAQKYQEKTNSHIKLMSYPDNTKVIFSPNEEISKKSNKGSALINELKSLIYLPKRIVVVDDLCGNIQDIDESLANNKDYRNIPRALYLKKSNYRIFPNGNAAVDLPENLLDLKYVNSISGGSGGVHILKDQNNSKQYTFKCVENPEQMKEEMVADALYQALGIPVPEFAVYDHRPNELKEKCPGPGPYRLARWVEKDKKSDSDLMKQEVKKHFIADAFLGNWDIVADDFKNVILDSNKKLWRIDNGGSLRFRAKGELKSEVKDWNPNIVNELESMRDKNINSDGFSVYGTLSEEELSCQANELYRKSHKLFASLDDIAKGIDLKNHEEVREMLRRRLDHLVKRFDIKDTKVSFKALARMPATKDSAAGILVYSVDPKTKKQVVLLGKRTNHRWWGNFGGKSDINIGRRI